MHQSLQIARRSWRVERCLRWSGSWIDAKIAHIETGAEIASTPAPKYAANLPTHA